MKEYLQRAMRSLSITELWKRRGWAGTPGKSCHFPGDADGKKKASCSIFMATTGKHSGCELLKCHRRGLTYDAPGLLSEVEGLPIKDSCKLFITLAGVKPLDENGARKGSDKSSKSTPAYKAAPAPKEKDPEPPAVDFRVMSPRPLEPSEIDAISIERNVSARAIEWLAKQGVLSAVTLSRDLKLPIPRELRPFDAWALHHANDWRSFRVRAFVGLLPGFDGHFHKSLTPSGGGCSEPVWIGSSDALRILLIEGEGDSIGAAELIRRERSAEGLAVVVMFSSSIAIPSTFLPRFEGRRVRIVPHCGDSRRQGETAAVKWASSLKPWAAEIEIFTLAGLETRDGKSVGDLGDLAQCTDELLESLNGVTAW